MGTRNSLIVFTEHSSLREASRTDIIFGFPEDRISKISALSAAQLIINPYGYRYVKTFYGVRHLDGAFLGKKFKNPSKY